MSDTSQQQTTGQAFLEAWQRTIQPKLSQLLSLLGTHAVAKNLALAQVRERALCCRFSAFLVSVGGFFISRHPCHFFFAVQVITYLPVLTEGKQMLRAEEVCLIGNQALQEFHSRW